MAKSINTRMGRPPSPEGRAKVALSLPPAFVAKLFEWGNGSPSQAVRALIEARIAAEPAETHNTKKDSIETPMPPASTSDAG